MVKNKSQGKQKNGGVDFKKIRRKIGRKLPPPKNATNTEIKSKSIVLPEQSIVSEKEGFAVSKKGLTLKELLHQTSHHNAKARKEALLGIKDILLKHPAELKLNKLAVVEKLRERISDDDKFVRETLYQLFKSIIFLGCAQDNHGPLVSLMMLYIFNAMTNLAIDVRVTAFKFCDLVVQFSPPSFSLNAEKILQNYGDILSKNQFLEDKSKLKSILDGLMRCLSLLPCNKGEDPSVKDVPSDSPTHLVLHAFEPETVNESLGFNGITNKLEDLLSILIGCFLDFMPTLHSNLHLDMQSYDCMLFMLQSVDLIVGFFVGRVCETLPDTRVLPHPQLPDKTYNQFISPVILKKLWDTFPLNLANHLSAKDNDQIFRLNIVITKIFLQLSNLDCSPDSLLEKFLDFIESSLITEAQSGKAFHEKLLLPIIPYIPKLIMHISGDWRSRILHVFTDVSKNSSPESSMKLYCLAAIEEMLGLGRSLLYTHENDPILLHYQIEWIKDFPSLLISLDNRKPLCSKTVLRLQLLVGQSFPNSPLSQEFDTLQYHFRDFFSSQTENGVLYGPFVRLPADIQELSLSCLYYFTYMDSPLLQSLVSCCLCEDLEPCLVYRILEVLHSAFRAGHVQLADYASFYITLLSRFHVYPEKAFPAAKHDGKSNLITFKHITRIACSYLSQIGDNSLIFQMLEKIIIDHICSEIAIENKCGFLRLLVSLDSKPSKLSDHSIAKITHAIPEYLINVIFNIGEEDTNESMSPIYAKRWKHYLLPSFHLFHGSRRLLHTVLNVMGSWLSKDSSTLASDPLLSSVSRLTLAHAVGSLLLHMCADDKMKRIMLQSKIKIENILQNMLNLQSCESARLTLEERHHIQTLNDRLRAITMSGHR